MKILCAYLCDYRDRNDYFISLMPNGITSIAAYLERNGHDVILANFSKSGYKKAVKSVLSINPEIIFLSIFSFNRTESFKLIEELKRKSQKIKVVIGGHHATFLYNMILNKYPEIDHIITGEGELAALDIVEKKTDEKIIHGKRIDDIDSLPYPSMLKGKMTGFDPHEQFRYIITSRGCPSSCTYCSSPGFWNRKVTFRSPENIIDELRFLQKKYGIIYFSIRDDNFTLNKKRVLEFSDMLINSGLYFLWNCQARVDTVDLEMLSRMKEAGLEHIQYGIESGSEKILNLYDKSINLEKIKKTSSLTRKAGILLSFYLMTGLREEREQDVNFTIDLIEETKPHDIIVSPVAYYPGTEIYLNDKNSGLVDDSIWFKRSDNGIFVGDMETNRSRLEKIIYAGEKNKKISTYKSSDFSHHRKNDRGNTWVTDILEGDYNAGCGNIKKAERFYRRIADRFPENIWGYLRLAQIVKSPVESEKLLKKATSVVPNNHDIWADLSEVQFQLGKKKEAEKSLSKSKQLELTEF